MKQLLVLSLLLSYGFAMSYKPKATPPPTKTPMYVAAGNFHDGPLDVTDYMRSGRAVVTIANRSGQAVLLWRDTEPGAHGLPWLPDSKGYVCYVKVDKDDAKYIINVEGDIPNQQVACTDLNYFIAYW
jgi:hypothetical protein